MANKYLKQFPVPEEYPNILRDLTREILRLQPRDIISFAAQYFKCKENNTEFIWDDPDPRAPRPCDYSKHKVQVNKTEQENTSGSLPDLKAQTQDAKEVSKTEQTNTSGSLPDLKAQTQDAAKTYVEFLIQQAIDNYIF